MKKIIFAVTTCLLTIAANAEDKTDPLIDRSLVFDVVNICGILLVMYIISAFILSFLQRNLDHRLKNKIIDAGTPEGIVSHLLQPKEKDYRKPVLQWICVLLGIGTGLVIIHATQPFGMHSVAIMAFSLGAGLLAYYLLTRQKPLL